jgi:hypothetical protein
MKTSAFGLATLLILAGCSKQETPSPQPAESASGNPVTAPVDYIGAVGRAKKVAEKTVDAVSLNQAIQLFYAQEDRFPKDLNELVADGHIARIPAPPAGMAWKYNPQTGAITAVRSQ